MHVHLFCLEEAIIASAHYWRSVSPQRFGAMASSDFDMMALQAMGDFREKEQLKDRVKQLERELEESKRKADRQRVELLRAHEESATLAREAAVATSKYSILLKKCVERDMSVNTLLWGE